MVENRPSLYPYAAERPTRKANAVERMMAEHFSSSELWQGEPRWFPRSSCGLIDPSGFAAFDDHETAAVMAYPAHSWLAAIYGIQLMPGNRDNSFAIKTEMTNFKTLTKIHEKLRDTVLIDEHIRPALPIVPPVPVAYPDRPSSYTANNKKWLEVIAQGYWPIMSEVSEPRDHPKDYYSHDYYTPHPGNSALEPREIQDKFTIIANNAYEWKARREQGQVPLLDYYHSDVFYYAPHQGDGLAYIDTISGNKNYMDLLVFLVDDPKVSCSQRLSLLMMAEEDKRSHTPFAHAVTGLRTMSLYAEALTSFITRHGEGRYATEEELHQASQDFQNGVVRVAQKIRGI